MNTEILEKSIKDIVGLRGEKRQQKFNLIKNQILRFLNDTKTKKFNRTLLLSFFSEDDFSNTAKSNLINRVLKEFKESNLIIEDTTSKKRKKSLRVEPLNCFDNESYSLMMSKNGYKVVDFFNWEYVNNIPKKIKIGTLPLNVNPDFDFDVSELRQTKTIQNQAVYSKSQKSIMLRSDKPYSVKCYRVL